MRRRLTWRGLALFSCVLVAVAFAVAAHPGAATKRPLSYDAVEYWKSIGNPTLSADGQWLAYAITSQAEDGELVIRNLKTDQEFKQPRGTAPTFTEDGKFVVFTIAQSKAEEEKERLAAEAAAAAPAAGAGAAGQAGGAPAAAAGAAGGPPTPPATAGQAGGRAGRGGQGAGRGGAAAARTEPRTGMGIMTLADGTVKTFDKIGSFQVPRDSSTWLAYYKGNGGRGAGGGGGRGAGGRGGAAPAAGAGRGGAGQGTAAAATGEKTKPNGFDLILRNLATSEEVTIPDVVEYEMDNKGTWLAYATSAADGAKDGAFLRKLADGTVKTLLSGKGHYKSLAFDEAGQQVAFLSDAAEYDKPVSPYRLYLWKPTEPAPLKPGTKPAAAPAKPAAAAAVPAKPATPAAAPVAPAKPAEPAKPAAAPAAAPGAPAPAAAPAKPGEQAPAAAGAAPAAPAKPVFVPPTGEAIELVSAATPGMPKGQVVADTVAPSFSRDGARLMLATGNPPVPPADPAVKTPAVIGVDMWSYKDPVLQPMQKLQVQQDRNRTYAAVYHVADKKFVQLATPELPGVSVNPRDDHGRALGTNPQPYRMESSWDQSYNDVYVVDIKTGAAKQVLQHWGNTSMLSTGGKYVLYFDERNGQWFTYRIADGVRTNLTEKLKVGFQQEPTMPELPGAYGQGGWTANDASVLLYDEFDIWEVKPDGTGARMITGGEGRKQNLAFRYRNLDPEERVVPTNQPLLLTVTNEKTRATGFYRVPFAGTSVPEKLLMLDKAVGAPVKAKKAETMVFAMTRFEEFGDLWIASDLTFKDMKKISNANPQQAEFVWGRSELIEYINGDGKRVKAILTKPENFDPSKKYPLIVYIYETMTQGLHTYGMPNLRDTLSLIRYVSNGYVLLQPDIIYTTGFPGESAEKCVIPAVNTVVAMGYIDPKRIGIQGHSWGGYEITHLITRTDIFAAVEAGASVSNMISAYGGIRWGSGMVREFQYEKSQSRIGATPWDAPLLYIENSPIFWIKKINTPYLTIHNDADDAVPWYQGIEFNTAMRRLGKEAYMFNYYGEPHHLANRDNMKHFTVHMDEFFDHYLLGAPRPEWMDKGVSYLDHGKRDVLPMFKKKIEKTEAKPEVK